MMVRSEKCGGALLAIVFAAAAVGCVSLQSASSGQIGCAEQDIVISDESRGWGSRTWTAECHGKRFFCTAVATGNDNTQVNCKESVGDGKGDATAAAATAVPAGDVATADSGCRYDAQCKGDRVCVKGECVDPKPTSPPSTTAPTPPPAE